VVNIGSRRAVGIHPDLVSVPIKTAEMLTGAGWEGVQPFPYPLYTGFPVAFWGKILSSSGDFLDEGGT
jgi:hypothetical protein